MKTPRRRRRRAAPPNETLARIVADHHARFRRTEDFQDALKLIQPTHERRARCGDDVYRAALGVRVAELFKPSSPKIHKEHLLKVAKKLKAVETEVVLSASAMNELKSHREHYERVAGTIHVRPGSRRLDNTKRIATHYAHWLLTEYGSRPPGVTSGGRWQKLATILYRNRDADLFEYLRDYRDFAPLYAAPDLSEIDNLEAAYR